MWIFFSILGFIILLVVIALFLPIRIIIKTDQNGEITFLGKFLFKTFGDKPNPKSNQSFLKTLKELTGMDKLDKKNLKTNGVREFFKVIGESISTIVSLLKQILDILKLCTVKTLKINIICSQEDAAQTAINYGICYAVISPLLNFLHSSMKVKSSGEQINISCDFEHQKSHYDFEIVLSVRIITLIKALFRAAKLKRSQ